MNSLLLMLTLCLNPSLSPGDTTRQLVTLTYAAGYIPNIQFAPFYIAMSRGYYAEEGIKLTMDYTMGSEVLKMVALKKAQIGSVDPDAFLHAVTRKMPLIHIATLYQHYPITLIAREPILNAKDLKNKRIGVFGTYGASYLGLKAILEEMGLSLADVRVAAIGFTQVTSLETGRVDAVVGYANNEPLRLKSLGINTFTRMLSGQNNFPGVGLMTETSWHQQNKALVDGFLRATFRGMRDVLADPESCFKQIVPEYLPELTGSAGDAEFQVLLATLPYWSSAYVDKNGLGQCQEESWANLVTLLGRDEETNPYANWRSWMDRSFSYK